ncbi:MAG: archease [Candidatus Saganbacteria bacterium]|nr:archease [Candidatus Saganbacteria bacterium]
MKRFEPLDHPSDVGIIAYGKTLPEVFESAAAGMFSIMGDLEAVRIKSSFDIKADGDNKESLLINWLNELIYLEDTKKVILKEFKIKSFFETKLEAEVSGEKIDLSRHKFARPIKAATYNQLLIEQKGKTWSARVVFDV